MFQIIIKIVVSGIVLYVMFIFWKTDIDFKKWLRGKVEIAPAKESKPDYHSLSPRIKKKLIADLETIRNDHEHLDMNVFLDTESGNANRDMFEKELIEILVEAGFNVQASGSVIVRGPSDVPMNILLNPANIEFAKRLSEALRQFINIEIPLETDEGFPSGSLKIFIHSAPLFSPDGVVTFQ